MTAAPAVSSAPVAPTAPTTRLTPTLTSIGPWLRTRQTFPGSAGATCTKLWSSVFGVGSRFVGRSPKPLSGTTTLGLLALLVMVNEVAREPSESGRKLRSSTQLFPL